MYHFHIADDHPLFRNALLEVISGDMPDAATTQSFDFAGTLEQLEANPDTDLLLLDLHMPGSQDLFGLISVREKFPSIPVVVISSTDDPNTISRAIGHGAAGFIPKSTPPEQITEALNQVLEGDSWVPEALRGRLRPVDANEKSMASRIATLTPHQYKVLQYIREGWLNKQIAYELGITEATVKAHITSIFKKLGASNRTQAVVMLSKMSLDENDEPAGTDL